MQRTIISLLILTLFASLAASAQTERKSIRKGNKEFKKGEFLDSEIMYRSALDVNPSSFKGNFNLGDALYKQEKFEEAEQVFSDIATRNNDSKKLSSAYHNLGNAHFQKEEYDKSVEAFKNALRHNPTDNETKYNLAQAQRMLMQQQDQQQDQDKDKQDKDNKDNDQDQKDQDKQDKENDQDKKEQDQQQQKQQISQEDARRMLEAIQNNEKEVQEKVQKEKAKQAKVKVEKNW